WEQALSKIEIEASETDKRIFYTSLYHTLVAPITFNAGQSA
ncbi:MAG: glycoside hydrolase family 92 protein, partial [Clostridia bacterium]|nr:glycoside hydrolase family 92 protein [Clostridia bacterium]